MVSTRTLIAMLMSGNSGAIELNTCNLVTQLNMNTVQFVSAGQSRTLATAALSGERMDCNTQA